MRCDIVTPRVGNKKNCFTDREIYRSQTMCPTLPLSCPRQNVNHIETKHRSTDPGPVVKTSTADQAHGTPSSEPDSNDISNIPMYQVDLQPCAYT